MQITVGNLCLYNDLWLLLRYIGQCFLLGLSGTQVDTDIDTDHKEPPF